jgi:tetratricopeptide (TPR) repeat protein
MAAPPSVLGTPLCVGSRPADEALDIIDQYLAEGPSPWLGLARGWLLAMLDRPGAAHEAGEAYERLRDHDYALWGEMVLSEIAMLAGDYEEATTRRKVLCEWIEAQGQTAFLEYELARVARTLCMLGSFDEAESFADRSRALEEARGPDVTSDGWAGPMSRVHLHRGDLAEAERLARAASAASDMTQLLSAQADTLWDLAEVLAAAGRADEAAATFEQALERCARKKNLALARQIRVRRDSLLAG